MVDDSSVTTVEEICSHATTDRENSSTSTEGEIPEIIIRRAVEEVFGKKSTRMRINKIRVQAYKGLRKKRVDVNRSKNHLEEWKVFNLKAEEIVPATWNVVRSNGTCISFVRFESVRYNDQIVVSELRFIKHSREERTTTSIKYHERELPKEVVSAAEVNFGDCELKDRAVMWMKLIETSFVCHGFTANFDFEDDRIKLYNVVTNDLLIAEERGFSPQCEVLTNTAGFRCKKCWDEKRRLEKKVSRKNATCDKPLHSHTNHRYMTKDQVIDKLENEKKGRLAAQRKIEQIKQEMLELDEEDHNDMAAIMSQVKKDDVPEDMLLFWEEQKKILETKAKCRYRWHPRVMKLCIELYVKNPHVLDSLRQVIYLPSNRTIRHYKNKAEQQPGWNANLLKWCLEEAKKNNLQEQDYWGGLILDEMKIQEDVEMVVKGGKHRLVGFVDLGKIHDNMQILSGTKTGPTLATHVLQFIFLGDNGFRFPIAQFPSTGCTASSLFFLFWEGVRKMLETGFTVYYCILDGAEINRQFIRLHFVDDKEAEQRHFTCHNIYNGGSPLVFLMDPKHNIKKLRNNILKSSLNGNTTRCLQYDKYILWEHFVNAFNYDQGTFSMSYHEKLTADHFELTPSSKMRNHLAEEVLNKNMLSLMKAYRVHLASKPGQDPSSLDATIALLSHTSEMVALFHDRCGIRSIQDKRLKDLGLFLDFMNKWRLVAGGNGRQFVSQKLFFDLASMILGFQAIVSIKLKRYANSIIKPAIINQDAVENHFCQVRACNGQNNNPTWRLQETCQNTIRYGQTTISRKSNASLNHRKNH